MKLQATYDKKEDIPERFVDIYKEKGDKWCIEIEGIQTDANVQRLEFSLKKERDENAKLREDAKLHGKTPEEVQIMAEELEAAKATIESGGDKKTEEQIAKIVEARIKQQVGPLERNITKLTKERDESVLSTTNLTTEIMTGKIELAIRTAAEKAKVIPSAINDMVMRGKPQFELLEQDGKVLIVTKDGLGNTAGLAPEGWIEELAPSAPHYWPANQGAGANGAGLTLGITEKNPWTKANWNMTEKGEILKKYGTEKASQLAKAAGSSLHATVAPDK
jgi:hypothetical protein